MWLRTGQIPGKRIVTAAFLSFVGGILLSYTNVQSFSIGDGLCLLSALLYALWIISVDKNARYRDTPVTMAVLQFSLPVIAGCGMAFLFEHVTAGAVLKAAPDLLLAGVFGSGISTAMALRAQASLDATTSAICYSCEAVVGSLIAYFWLSELLAPLGVVGSFLILVGILLSQTREEAVSANSV